MRALEESQRRLLVVQLADLGDLILAAPAIQYIRKRDPTAHVALFTKPSNLALAQQLADDVIVADKHLYDRHSALLRPKALLGIARLILLLRRQQFNEIIILHHFSTRFGAVKWAALSLLSGARLRRGVDNGRGWFLNRRTRDRGFGAENEEAYWLEVAGGAASTDLNSDNGAAELLLSSRGINAQFVAIHPGSGSYSLARRWPIAHFATLAQTLSREIDCDIVVVGGEEERELGAAIAAAHPDRSVNLCGETDLARLVALLRKAKLFVGNNAGVAQIASFLGVPSIVIFGPTSPRTWHVQSQTSRAVSLDLACSPCFYRDHELGTPQGCGTRECLLGLSPERVLTEVRALLRDTFAA